MLEKVVYIRLFVFINSNALLSTKQHGFVASRSTLTNLLQSEATIRDFQLRRHPHDVSVFDFEKAFDKAPHLCVIRAVQSIVISGPALKWLESFLTGRTFRVRIGDTLSDATLVSSGVFQESTLGPILYDICINSL